MEKPVLTPPSGLSFNQSLSEQMAWLKQHLDASAPPNNRLREAMEKVAPQGGKPSPTAKIGDSPC